MRQQKNKLNIVKIILCLYIFAVFAITQLPVEFTFVINFSNAQINLMPFKFLVDAINKLSIVNSNGLNIWAYTLPIFKTIVESFGYNIILFLPMGFLLPMINKKFFSFKKVFAISLISSLYIEINQLIVGVVTTTSNRCFDMDDIIANTGGGILGFLLYTIALKYTKRAFEKKINTAHEN